MLAAYIPAVPTGVATVIEGSQIKISWALSTTNGSPITAYKVFVLEMDTGAYTLESTDCVGSDATVISNE